MDCAPSPNCARTCDNYDQLLGCPPECGSFNCICPNGMVIDKEKNTCVEQTGCPGNYIIMYPHVHSFTCMVINWMLKLF